MINYNDENTWSLFKEGKTKGIFQLESNLGKAWSKKVQPKNIEELAALISLIRPGTLKAISEGKSMTQHYVDRKHGRDPVVYIHDSLSDILGTTYGVIVYQEQSMRIAEKLAGFNLQEADELRKAIGKKKADLMAKVKQKFLLGCINKGIVSEDVAKEIWSWIEKSSRYAFNKSHAVAYAFNAYHSAYYKANNTKKFFLSYLYHSSEKQDPHQEVYELVSEAKLFDIEIKIPNLIDYSDKFDIRNDKIYFGIKDIKSLTGVTGNKVIEVIQNAETELNKQAKDFTWMDILVYLSPNINSTAFKSLCSIGFFSNSKTLISRNRALYEFAVMQELTKAELTWIINNYKSKQWKNLIECFKDLAPTKKQGGGTSSVERSQKINNEIYYFSNPPYELEDNPEWIIENERKLLGCPISLAKIESSDTSSANTSCKEIVNGKTGKGMCVAASINRITTCKVKKGKTKGELMAFLTIEDDTCSIDNVVVFPGTRKDYEYILYEGNNLLFCGSIEKNDGSFIVEKIHEI